MISIGIFTGYYPYTMAEVIAASKSGSCVQLDVRSDFDAAKERSQRRRMKFGTFPEGDLPIVAVSAYNLFIPSGRQKISITQMMMRCAAGCHVASETAIPKRLGMA